MRRIFHISLVLVFAALAFAAGCLDSGTVSTQTQTSTATPISTQFTEQPTTAAVSDIIPGPTEQPPDIYLVDVQVNKDMVYGTITAIFRGGLGQNFVYDIVVEVYYPDGTSETKHLSATNVGDSAEFKGNQNKQDRVKVTVVYDGNLGTYVISDQLVPDKLPTNLS